jgi:hypothetical protein
MGHSNLVSVEFSASRTIGLRPHAAWREAADRARPFHIDRVEIAHLNRTTLLTGFARSVTLSQLLCLSRISVPCVVCLSVVFVVSRYPVILQGRTTTCICFV